MKISKKIGVSAKLSKIRDIPLSEIDPFRDHPFQVQDDEMRICRNLLRVSKSMAYDAKT